jgi:TRAP-type mannitol/chloroaromatic compound transport system permease small subunit
MSYNMSNEHHNLNCLHLTGYTMNKIDAEYSHVPSRGKIWPAVPGCHFFFLYAFFPFVLLGLEFAIAKWETTEKLQLSVDERNGADQ